MDVQSLLQDFTIIIFSMCQRENKFHICIDLGVINYNRDAG